MGTPHVAPSFGDVTSYTDRAAVGLTRTSHHRAGPCGAERNGVALTTVSMRVSIFRSRSLVLLGFAVAAVVPGCRDKPQEISTPALTAAQTPAVAPLLYELPGTWTKLGETQVGNKRAGYKVPKAGADSEDAELVVFFFGTGSQGDQDKNFKEWFDAFDADAAPTAARKTFDSPAGKVEALEAMGTYKVPLGPAVGPKKKSPMQMVKEKWRLYAAVVHTKDRGNWFFRLVGPDETVQTAKSALEAALQAAK